MAAPQLPLFQLTENREALRSLQERRSALLKRLHGMPPHSRMRVAMTYQLTLVTAELLRAETRAFPDETKGGRRG